MKEKEKENKPRIINHIMLEVNTIKRTTCIQLSWNFKEANEVFLFLAAKTFAVV